MTTDSKRSLHPEVIKRIGRLEIRARHIVEGLLSGMHRSPYFGQSVEFLQHREYARGDDLRRVETASCACRDSDCANHVQAEFESWAKAHADTKGSQAEAEQAGKIAEHISECMVRAMTGSSP